jgi:hypothetical protein
MLLLTKTKKSVTLRNFCYWIRYYLGLNQTGVATLKKFHKHSIVYVLVEVADIKLKVTLWCWLKLSKLTNGGSLGYHGRGYQFIELIFRAVTCPV